MNNCTEKNETAHKLPNQNEAKYLDFAPKTVHFAHHRKPVYQTKTVILEDARGNRIVQKTPLHPEGVPFLSQSNALLPALKSQYEPLGLRIANQTWDGRIMEIEYIHGEPLSERLAECAFQRDTRTFIALFRRYAGLIRASGCMNFETGSAFKSVFGNVKLPYGLKSACVSNIDLIPQNIIVTPKEEWVMIDPEWTFDFPIPVDFVLYRAVFYLRDSHPDLRQTLTKAGIDLWTLGGIRAERSRYLRMEENFQSGTVGIHDHQTTDASAKPPRPTGFIARMKKSTLDLAMKTPLKWRFLERNAFRD